MNHLTSLEAFGSAYTHGGSGSGGGLTWKNPPQKICHMFFCCFFFKCFRYKFFSSYGLLMLCFYLVHFQKIFVLFWVISGFVTVITLSHCGRYSIGASLLACCQLYFQMVRAPEAKRFGKNPLKKNKDTGYPSR